MYTIVSPDYNAGVGVYTEAADGVDTNGLETEIVTKLPVFLQAYGGSATGTPQFQAAAVDGVPAVVSAFPVMKNGLDGIASVSAVSSGGHIYFVWGLVVDRTSPLAAQETAQVQTIMDGFHLR
jgi:hypothetical protein